MIKKNILANFVGRFWGILSNFLFIPVYISYLGFESYSVISFTLLIAGIMAVLDAGLTATLSREFSRGDNANSEKYLVFKSLETVYLLLVAVCIFILLFSSGLISNNWINLVSYSSDDVALLIRIISFEIGFQLLFRFYIGGLLGLDRQIKANMYQIAWGVLRNGLVILVIMFVPTLKFFFLWQTVSTIIFVLLLKLSLEKELTGRSSFNISLKLKKAILSRIWQFAGGMMLISLVSIFNTQMDKIAISKLLSLESLGYYTLAISLAQGIIILVNPIATALLPKFTAYYSTGNIKAASSLFYQISLVVSVLVFSFMANMIFFGEDLVWVWTGDVMLANNISTIIPIVALGYASLSLQVIPFHIAIANGYTKLNNVLGGVSLCLTLPGYWILTKSHGAFGAASVFFGVQFVTTLIYIYYINKKFIGIPALGKFLLKQIALPFILANIIAYGLSNVPAFFAVNRLFTLMWIGLSTALTLVFSLMVLMPLKDLKRMTLVGLITSKSGN